MQIIKTIKQNKKITLAAIALVMVVATVLTVFAFLTDRDHVENIFHIGDVNIKLDEPSWIPSDAQNIWTNRTLVKDPTVINIGDNDAYVYILVVVPKRSVITVNENGMPLNNGHAVLQELFTYTVNPMWSLYMQDVTGHNDNNYYLYVYDEALDKYNGATNEHNDPVYAASTPLFNEITLKDIIEGQIQIDENLNIDVFAYAIQSNYASGDATSERTPFETWAFYYNQNGLNLPDGRTITLSSATP